MVVLYTTPDSEKSLMIRFAVSTEYRRVMARQSERQTDSLRRNSLRYA